MPASLRRVGPAVLSVLAVAVTVAALLGGASLPAAAATPLAPSATPSVPAGFAPAPAVDKDVCSGVGPQGPGYARCFTVTHQPQVRNTRTGAVTPAAAAAAPVGGITPTDLRSAYGVSSVPAGTGTTVAIVDAYDAPSVEADLATFRSYWGMSACTTANGCFRKVDQRGAVVPAGKSRTSTTAPIYNSTWEVEITLDVEAVSSICPGCSILLVEADSTSLTSALGPAVARAVTLGATIVSNSFGAPESAAQLTAESQYWNQPGVSIFASTGDDGWDNYATSTLDPAYGLANFPATSPYVTAVGGTSLSVSGGTIQNERAWSDAGSGCSLLEARPGYQATYFTATRTDPDPAGSGTSYCVRPSTYGGGAARAEADVSALADPNAPGFPLYLGGKWTMAGGTSLSSPIVAGLQGLAGSRGAETSLNAVAYGLAAAGASPLHDVTSGSNAEGTSCSGNAVCTGGVGWDGPTGLGSPRGLSLFQSLLTVAPTTAVPGATITVTGADFVPGETVDLTSSASGFTPAVATANTAGGFSATVQIPVTAPGPFPVTATGRTSGFTATRSIPFTAPSVTVAKTSGVVPLASLSVAVAGFAAGESVSVGAAGGTPSSVSASATGSATTTVVVPAGVGATTTITAVGSTSGRTSSTSVPVVPASLTPASQTARPGQTVTLAAVGFGSRESITSSLGTAPAAAGSDGTFAVTWTVPTSVTGTFTLTVTGAQTARTATATIAVSAVLNPLPAIAPGATATLTGAGFQPNENVSVVGSPAGNVVPIAGATADALGNVSVRIAVPAMACPVAVTVTVTGASSARSASTTFQVGTGSILYTGCTLVAGQSITSPSGQYQLFMQGDGNLVLYGNGLALWNSATFGTNPRAVVQTDGNFVVYTSAGYQWASFTSGAGAFLALQNDSNLVLYAGGRATWATGTSASDRMVPVSHLLPGWTLQSPDNQYTLVLQGDGNLVEYGPGNRAIWNTQTQGSMSVTLELQADGNLVLYTATGVRFASYTSGSGNRLQLQNDGNLVVYSPTGRALWNSYGF